MLMKKEVIEDNETLKGMICDLRVQLSKEKQVYINMYNMYDEEKKKNEKAIEYIENNNFHCKNQEEQKQYDRELFKILKGENKE